MKPLTAREERILRAIVEIFTRSGEPVSSNAVSGHFGRDLSPASVRAVMADLERAGLLHSRHASSGRTPTEEALRHYALEAIAKAEASAIPKLERDPPERMLRGAARWLADASHATAVLCSPRLGAAFLRQIRFVPLRGRTLLAVLVTQEGLRSECVIEALAPLSDEELDRVHELLAERVDGRTLQEVRDAFEKELRVTSRTLDRVRASALWLASQALGVPRPEVLVEGEMNLLGHPDLDADRLRSVLSALRERERLVELLDRTLEHEGKVVWVSESSALPSLKGLALIAMPYGAAGALGTIAVLGPARLDYGRVASLVDSAARALSSNLARTME